MTACLKQRVMCVIQWWGRDGRLTWVTGENDCAVTGLKECPRVSHGCATGEGYDLCGPPIHAEIAAIAALPDGETIAHGVAFLYGHDWFCGPCQKALTAVGVDTFVITGEGAEDAVTSGSDPRPVRG